MRKDEENKTENEETVNPDLNVPNPKTVKP